MCFNESVVLNVIYDQQAIVLLTLRLRWGVLSYSDEFLITCCYFDPWLDPEREKSQRSRQHTTSGIWQFSGTKRVGKHLKSKD